MNSVQPFIDWAILHNPILEYPTWSVKDYAVVYREGTFSLFFSAFYASNGRIRTHLVEVSTKDFKTYSEPLLNFAGEEDNWIGMCSPDVTQVDNTYYLTLNSWGDIPGKPNQLFFMTSHDLMNWSDYKPLAANLTTERAIDAAVAYHNNKFFLIWKEVQTPKVAVGETMEGDFSVVGYPDFLKLPSDRSVKLENYQFLKIDDKWCLLGTKMDEGHYPNLYRMAGDGDSESDWLSWTDGHELTVGRQHFNTKDGANSAMLADWRKHDGFFYLFYAGTNEGDGYLGRGWNRLGIARSKDLLHWETADSAKSA